MKIVLRQDVPKLGESGSVQDVANGYARNFLIPRGLAVVATSGELKVAAHNQAVQARKIVKQEQQLQSLADRIAGQRLEFTARAGEGGRLYGSITAGDVAERLSAAVGEDVDRRRVVLEEPIRTLGQHAVTVHLVGRLRPQVTIVVQGEAEEGAAPAAADESMESAAAEAGAQGAGMSESKRGAGGSGHPEPGSGHDDGKTETVAEGPDVDAVDGVPGAHGEVETRGGAVGETTTAGKAVEVADEAGS